MGKINTSSTSVFLGKRGVFIVNPAQGVNRETMVDYIIKIIKLY